MKHRRCVNEHHNPYKLSQMTTIEADHVSAKLTSREDTINLFHSQETTTSDTHGTQPTASARHHHQDTLPPLPHLSLFPSYPNLTPTASLPPRGCLPRLPLPQNGKTISTPISRQRRIRAQRLLSSTRRSRSRPQRDSPARAREIAPARRMHARMHVSAPADCTASQASPCIGAAHLVSQPRE
jgi:hypothetical protein